MQSQMADTATYTLFTANSRKSQRWKNESWSWAQLCARLKAVTRTSETVEQYKQLNRETRGQLKDVGGFVGGRFFGARRVKSQLADRCLITLDADYADIDRIREFFMLYGLSGVLYTTHSHTPENPRVRLVLPLGKAIGVELYQPVARKVAEWCGIEMFDDTTYDPVRLMYWPSCPKDGEYLCEMFEGEAVNPDEVLAEYTNYHDCSSWPRSSREQGELRQSTVKAGDPLTKPGLIGAFNRAYDIPAAIDAFLPDTYTPSGDGRYTYAEGSTQGGAVLYPNEDGIDDLFLYSFHDSDPCSMRLVNAYDMVRLHKYGALDQGEEETDLALRPSTRAMTLLLMEDERVQAELEKGELDVPSEDASPDEAAFELPELKRFTADYTDAGAALDFSGRYRSQLRYNAGLGWLYYDGLRWVPDSENQAKTLLVQYTDAYLMDARRSVKNAEDPGEKKAALLRLNWANKMRGGNKLDSILKLSRAYLETREAEDFDREPYLLNTPGGVVDLRDGSMQANAPGLMLTHITAYAPEDGDCPLWQDFVGRLTGYNREYTLYLQRMLGMALYGKVFEEGLIISHGPGGNGKSTFFGTVGAVLGTYAEVVRPELIMAQQNGKEVAGMEGLFHKRFVAMPETEEGARMSNSLMKRLTSRDSISCNPKYKAPFAFVPTHTLIMHTNFPPRLRSLDGGTLRRITIAPFTMSLRPDEVITDFTDRLLAEAPKILKWMIDGAVDFCRSGYKLSKPKVVLDATAAYLEGEDRIGVFLRETCEEGPRLTVGCGTLYEAYKRFCDENNDYPKRSTDFGRYLEQQGYTRAHTRTGNMWSGIGLKVDGEELLY